MMNSFLFMLLFSLCHYYLKWRDCLLLYYLWICNTEREKILNTVSFLIWKRWVWSRIKHIHLHDPFLFAVEMMVKLWMTHINYVRIAGETHHIHAHDDREFSQSGPVVHNLLTLPPWYTNKSTSCAVCDEFIVSVTCLILISPAV